ncbi:hypothetical protein M7I_7808 [Glarea lozoyensis 74030]|uniref:Myb-like domain-containing protein n=1 Tax=Glarea lozoyensis (strain ATCC 74030 / MF5533) TaxID=1104152 RepID=H0EYA9_GLAL7|nr:hypothetical protein M7I_7808 [Glarea lozoyensis 74030]
MDNNSNAWGDSQPVTTTGDDTWNEQMEELGRSESHPWRASFARGSISELANSRVGLDDDVCQSHNQRDMEVFQPILASVDSINKSLWMAPRQARIDDHRMYEHQDYHDGLPAFGVQFGLGQQYNDTLTAIDDIDIRRKGKFTEAESTLRGRFRTLTKHKNARVRKPEWDENDDRLLKKAVRKMAYGSDVAHCKVPWKQVAEYISKHGGSYHFGNATCRKRWDELQKAA